MDWRVGARRLSQGPAKGLTSLHWGHRGPGPSCPSLTQRSKKHRPKGCDRADGKKLGETFGNSRPLAGVANTCWVPGNISLILVGQVEVILRVLIVSLSSWETHFHRVNTRSGYSWNAGSQNGQTVCVSVNNCNSSSFFALFSGHMVKLFACI